MAQSLKEDQPTKADQTTKADQPVETKSTIATNESTTKSQPINENQPIGIPTMQQAGGGVHVNYSYVRELSRHPQSMVCPYCHQNMLTVIRHEKGLITWLAVGAGCFFAYCCICLIPLMTNVVDDVVHTCSKCHQMIGIAKLLG